MTIELALLILMICVIVWFSLDKILSADKECLGRNEYGLPKVTIDIPMPPIKKAKKKKKKSEDTEDKPKKKKSKKKKKDE